MASQAFLYNAIFFTRALVLTQFYGISASAIPYYLIPFAIGNIRGPLLLGRRDQIEHFSRSAIQLERADKRRPKAGACCDSHGRGLFARLSSMKPVVEEIEALVARVGTHPVYGHAHCLRVYALAEDLAASEDVTYDKEILRVAALLHDVGLYKAYAMREPADHAKRSALVARRILQDWDFPPQASQAVIEAIELHPPGVPGSTASETILLKDAIGLDYLGAIGVSRMLAMVGTEEDVPDIPTAIWNAESLRQKIPDLLVLQSSKDLAARRIREMEDFFEDLRDATAKLKLL